MPADAIGPLRFEAGRLDRGAELVRQGPPAGAASFALTVVTPAGWGLEPPAQAGIALMASELATAGAGTRSRLEVARELDRHGASLVTDCHPECSEITLWGPADRLEELLPLLADAVIRPRFDAREVARLRRQIVERQMRERTQPDRRAERELFRRIYPKGHPYRETGLGSPASIAKIDRDDLRRFHRTCRTARASVVAATCREPLDRLAPLLDRAFEGWDGGPQAPSPALPRPSAPSAPYRVDVPGGSQVEIRVGGATLARDDPGYPAAFLANEILGGRPVISRLFQRLREKEGLVYHASSSLESMRWGGYWIAQAGADAAKAPRVLDRLTEETRILARREPPSGELDRVRESYIGSLHLQVETTASAHELATEVAYYHLPTTFYSEWPDRIRAISPREVREGAERGLDPARAATVLAGPLGRTSDGAIRP